jgi:hypothetical protein
MRGARNMSRDSPAPATYSSVQSYSLRPFLSPTRKRFRRVFAAHDAPFSLVISGIHVVLNSTQRRQSTVDVRSQMSPYILASAPVHVVPPPSRPRPIGDGCHLRDMYYADVLRLDLVRF